MKLISTRFEHEQIEEFQDGDCIFEEGDTGRDLYIVQSGAVSVVKKTSADPIFIAEFTKGDFFGDMALLQSIPRYASAYAKGTTRLLVLKPAGFLLKIRRDPTFAFEMLQQMSLRIKVTNDRLVELVQKFQIPREQVHEVLASVNGKL